MAAILVIEDEETVRRAISVILEQKGYELKSAEDGVAGLKALHEQTFDLVITDIYMPDKDGLAVIREIKRDFPDCKIIAISAYFLTLQDTYSKSVMEIGPDKVIPKPFDVDELLEAVKELTD